MSRSAFNLAEDVPTVRRITPSVRANTLDTRAARQLSTGRCAHAKQEDKPRRRLGQLRQRERLSLTNRTQRERLPLTNRTRGS